MKDWVIDKVRDEVIMPLIRKFIWDRIINYLAKSIKPKTKRVKYLIWGIGLLVSALLMLVFMIY